ncbi:hypothetical protein [Dysgonomonas sp. GY617]|uniref:hypothetical protein n=1 Tax=Dysgonomonas sp. GY617 TaxID=2780420 RepID=UPI00188402F9|nr:hypothetical protein [Dysgonomonas sp. GY617]MBF0575833.1 hypothetical protein [Dysgonomonas sp. GY617]
MEIKFSEIRNEKLYKQLIKMNCKSAMALGIAASEWILWRLCDWRENELNQDSTIQKEYIQALWCSLISKEYLSKERVTSHLGEIGSKIGESIALMDYSFMSLKLNYIGHNPRIYGTTLNLVELARYVSDDTDFFDNWFNSILQQSINLFPVPQDDLDEKGVFRFNNDKGFYPYLIIK